MFIGCEVYCIFIVNILRTNFNKSSLSLSFIHLFVAPGLLQKHYNGFLLFVAVYFLKLTSCSETAGVLFNVVSATYLATSSLIALLVKSERQVPSLFSHLLSCNDSEGET